jgi:capsular exopolysaccharide synthesis family protein
MSSEEKTLNPPVEEETHLRHYWRVLWQGRYTVAAVFLLVVALTAVYTFLQTPVFRATATVEVQPKATRLGPGQDVSGLGVAGYGGWWAEEKYHNTQVEIIRSADVAARAFQALALDTYPEFQLAHDPVDAFRQSILVTPRRETDLIEISIMGPDPDEVARRANAVAEVYVARNIEVAQQNVTHAMESIKDQVDDLRAELDAQELDRVDFGQKNRIYDPESQEELARQRLGAYHDELNKVELTIDRLDNQLNKIVELAENDADPMTLPELSRHLGLAELNGQKLEIERKIESAKVRYRSNHPSYVQLVSELDKVQQKIDGEVANILSSMRNELALAKDSRDDLRGKIAAAEEQSLEVVEATTKYELANTDSEIQKKLYDVILSRLQETELGAGLLSNNVRLLDSAKIPLYAVKPRKKVNLIIGAMFGMFLGIGTVFFLDYLDNTFRSPQDIERYLGLSVLGVVPRYVDSDRGQRAVREAYQSLRTSIIFSSKNRQRKVVLVTSTGPQEGKSSVIASLGRTLAGAGERVLVLDCDLRRPTQHVHLGLSREHGVTNFLAAPKSETDWSTYVTATDVPTLHAMVCGPIPPSPPELLGSSRFKQLLREASESYDWVLVDSPPAASLADSSLLATLTDMVVLVVRHNHTDRELVTRTVQQIRALNSPLVGAVLNNVDVERAFDKDYYYAGYYYYTDDDKRKRKKGSDAEVRAKAG